jgi:hypothetical protein
MKVIELVITPAGESRLETKGFAGADCQQASRLLEQALGRATGEQLTSEYYQSKVTADLPQLE